MAKLIFSIDNEEHLQTSREASKIEFEVPDDLDIFEYKTICIRLASAMGYHSDSIKKAFQNTDWETPGTQTIDDLLHEINKEGTD